MISAMMTPGAEAAAGGTPSAEGAKEFEAAPESEGDAASSSAAETRTPPLPLRPLSAPVRVMLSIPGRTFSGNFVRSLVSTVAAFLQTPRYELSLSFGYSSMVHFARMKTMGLDVLRGAEQKPFGGSKDYDVWVTVDSDMVWTPEQLSQLVEATSKHPVVSGIYRMEGGTHFSVVRDWDTEHFAKHGTFEFADVATVRAWNEAAKEVGDPFIPVAYNGMGFFAARREVLEALRYPYFDAPLQEIRGEGGVMLRDLCSEDVAFCRNIRAAGYNVMAKVDLILGHEKVVVL
jgi:hypothetical protein